MLTGPVTILCWSFPREDVSRETIAKQIALALRDEVADLEAAGIGIIQIDEPALREGLPLRRSDWDAYLQWGVEASVSTPPWRKMTHKSTLTCVIASQRHHGFDCGAGRRRHHHRNLAFRHGVAGVVLKSLIIQMKSVQASMTFTRQTYRAWNGLKPAEESGKNAFRQSACGSTRTVA